MEWFFGTTLGVTRYTTFVCLRFPLTLQTMYGSLRQAGKQHQTARTHASGGRDEGGITISRRPNKRPSSEKAPGPSSAIENPVITIPNATSLVSCKLRVGTGNHERAIPRKHSPTSIAAGGVRNPAAKAAPLVISAKPSTQVPAEGVDAPERQKIPSAPAAMPTAARNSNRPMPGWPPGNVEYSLCSAGLPERALRNAQLSNLRKCAGPQEPHIAASFRTTFREWVSAGLLVL